MAGFPVSVPEAAAARNLASGTVRKEVNEGNRHNRIAAKNPSLNTLQISLTIKGAFNIRYPKSQFLR
jgi:hypothetical protein